MSIFSSQVGTTPNRVEMFIDFIKSHNKTLTKKEIRTLFSPKEESTAFTDTFSFCNKFNIISLENDIVISNIEKKKNTKDIISNAIFQNNISEDNFLIVLSWFLSLDKKRLPTFSDNVGNLIEKDLSGLIREALSAQPWQNFVYWIQYLGFSTQLSLGNKTYIVPDPTNAIKLQLEKVCQKNEEIKIFEFLSNLSNIYPVLEFGVNRKYIDSHLREGLRLPDNQLSYSTSLAINRLERQGLIELISKADADVVSIESKRISHIKILGLKD